MQMTLTTLIVVKKELQRSAVEVSGLYNGLDVEDGGKEKSNFRPVFGLRL